MEINLKIQMSELSLHNQVYNLTIYQLLSPVFDCNFLLARYSDEYPSECQIEIGNYISDNFVSKIQGVSNVIDSEKIGFGGCWIEIDIYRPDLTFEIKNK